MKKPKEKFEVVDASCIDPGDPNGSFSVVRSARGPIAKITKVGVKSPKRVDRAMNCG